MILCILLLRVIVLLISERGLIGMCVWGWVWGCVHAIRVSVWMPLNSLLSLVDMGVSEIIKRLIFC